MQNHKNKKRIIQQCNNFWLFLYLSISTSLSLFSIIHKVSFNSKTIILSGITSSMEVAVETIKNFGKFLDSINSIIVTVTSVIGVEVIILLIAVLLISAAISFLGVPKGKFSFFCSLIVADIFWFLWIKNFNPEYSDLAGKIFIIIKTNFFLIIPFIIIYFFRSPVMLKKIFPMFASIVRNIFRKKSAYNKDMLIRLNEKIQETGMNFQRSIYNDVINKADAKEILLSDDTLKHKKELEDLLKQFGDQKKQS